MTRGLAFYNVSCIKLRLPSYELYDFADTPRVAHGLLYIACETAVFKVVGGKEHTFYRGNLVYLPMDIKYTALFTGETTADFTCMQVYYHLLDKQGNEYYIDDAPLCLLEHTPDKIVGNIMDMAYETVHSVYPTFRINKLFLEMMETISNKLWLPDISHSGNKVMPAIYYLSRHFNSDVPINKLATLCMMSESSFRRAFKEATGQTPALYKTQIKINKARELMRLDPTISTVTLAEELGFSDASYFYKTFEKIAGITVKEYRKSIK